MSAPLPIGRAEHCDCTEGKKHRAKNVSIPRPGGDCAGQRQEGEQSEVARLRVHSRPPIRKGQRPGCPSPVRELMARDVCLFVRFQREADMSRRIVRIISVAFDPKRTCATRRTLTVVGSALPKIGTITIAAIRRHAADMECCLGLRRCRSGIQVMGTTSWIATIELGAANASRFSKSRKALVKEWSPSIRTR